MKILKIILSIVVLLIVIPLVVALFLPNSYDVQREISVNKPNQEVFEYIKLLKNQENYSVWARMDPNMKKTYTGTDGTVGFVSAWDSNKEEVGAGEQEIIKIEEGKRIDFELRFIRPFEASDPAFMTTEPISDMTTKVVWGFNGTMAYPMNLMFLFIDFEEQLGGDLQKGLDTLKIVLEAMNNEEVTEEVGEM